MPLADMGGAVDLRCPALRRQHRLIGAEPHGPAEIATFFATLQRVAARPFRHLQAETDPEIGETALPGKPCCFDHPLRPTLAEAARYENAVNPIELSQRFGLGFEYLRL